MKKKSFSLHNLFQDNKFVMVFSLVIAVIFWASVCIAFSPETEVVVENVPVEIDMENSVPSQYGLKMFGENNYTVDITISGSKYIIGGRSITADAFKVTASTSLVTSAGTHSLQLKVSKADESANFTIEDYSEPFISVYFDEYAEAQANIEVKVEGDKITSGDYIADENYITDRKTVLVGGPALEVSQLSKVIATVSVDDPIEKSTAFNAKLSAVGKNGNELSFITFDGESNPTMTVTIPVYKKVTVPINAGFSGAPSNYITNPLEYTCSPKTVTVALLQNGTETEALKVADINFTTLKPGTNSFRYNLSAVDGVKVISGEASYVTLRVTVPAQSEGTFDILSNNISISNAPIDRSVNFTSSKISGITVYGNEQELSALNSDTLKARIDLANVEIKDGLNTVDVPLYIKDSYGCWIYGTYEISFTSQKIY
ncbi:MAG: hypothetical protein IJZ57_04565 [Clostridia bacterium]|nr:hypothetical protein [Clostridia bacterium]